MGGNLILFKNIFLINYKKWIMCIKSADIGGIDVPENIQKLTLQLLKHDKDDSLVLYFWELFNRKAIF